MLVPVGTPAPDLENVKHAVWIMVLAGMILAGVVATIRYRRERRAAWRERNADLAEHRVVTVTGVIYPLGEPLSAPLSGRACTGYRAHARVLDGPYGISVIGEPTELRTIRFLLVTANGPLVVDANAALEVSAQPLVPRQPEREAAFLANHGFAGRAPADGSFDEVVLAVGGRVTVVGMLVRERLPPEHGGYRDAGDQHVLITCATQPLTIRDPAW